MRDLRRVRTHVLLRSPLVVCSSTGRSHTDHKLCLHFWAKPQGIVVFAHVGGTYVAGEGQSAATVQSARSHRLNRSTGA